MKIQLEKVSLGFYARLDDKRIAGGNTWYEALGALAAMYPQEFGIREIAYARTDLTDDYRLRHSLNQVIHVEAEIK